MVNRDEIKPKGRPRTFDLELQRISPVPRRTSQKKGSGVLAYRLGKTASHQDISCLIILFAHLLALGHEEHLGGDLDLTLRNLGGDLEHLEEGGLSGVAAGGPRGHLHVDGSDRPHTGGGGHAVFLDDVTDLAEVTVGEDEADVADDLGQELRNAGKACNSTSKEERRQSLFRHM